MDKANPFVLSGAAPALDTPTAAIVGIGAGLCSADYLLIPNGSDAVPNTADRYCGGTLNPDGASATPTEVCCKF